MSLRICVIISLPNLNQSKEYISLISSLLTFSFKVFRGNSQVSENGWLSLRKMNCKLVQQYNKVTRLEEESGGWENDLEIIEEGRIDQIDTPDNIRK